MRPIDGEKIRNDIAIYLAENAYLNDTALDALKMVAKWLNEAPTLTADDYFDAVDRIKPCPNCRYTLLGALTEDEPRWIPVTERLPDSDEFVLVIVHGKPAKNITLHGAVELAECDPEGWILEMWPEWIDARVTHWMPLPTPPKENEP